MTWLEGAANMSAIIALIGVFVQLNIDAHRHRGEISLSYVQAYNAEPISAHRQRLEQMWLPKRGDLLAINESGGLRADGIDRLVHFVLTEYDGKHPEAPATLSMQELASFYDQVAICVEHKLCDPKVVEPYFYENMKEFWGTYGGAIKGARPAVSPQFGVALERLVSRLP